MENYGKSLGRTFGRAGGGSRGLFPSAVDARGARGAEVGVMILE